jgi:hypothetical protein
MRELLTAYLGVVIVLLALSTKIEADEGISLTHILIAAFGWPVVAPVIAWKAWFSRLL